MIYFLYSKQSPALRNGIKRIAKEILKDELDDFNFVRMDATQTPVQYAVSECQFLSIGSENKVVSLENCYFLLKEKDKVKIESDQDYDSLIKYLESPNNETTLIISVNSTNLNEKSPIVALLRKVAKVVPPKEHTEEEWNEYIGKFFREKLNVQIDNDAIFELGLRTFSDQELLINSAKKLALYTDHIRYDDVCLMVAKPLEDETYLIFNKLLEKRNGEALAIYRDLRVNNVEPVTLISQLGNQFRLLSNVSYLIKSGYNKENIAKELNIKVGRVYVLSKLCSLLSYECINDTLDKLYNLDLQIKSGQVDRFYAFELFLISFKAN